MHVITCDQALSGSCGGGKERKGPVRMGCILACVQTLLLLRNLRAKGKGEGEGSFSPSNSSTIVKSARRLAAFSNSIYPT